MRRIINLEEKQNKNKSMGSLQLELEPSTLSLVDASKLNKTRYKIIFDISILFID